MAKTSYIDITPPDLANFYKGLTAQDRFVNARLTCKVGLLSRKRKKGVTQKSLLPQVAEAWNALSAAEKTAWSNAGAEMNLNGYRLFVQDKCIRIINEMAGNATPSLLHQSWVGQLHIEAPATLLKIVQLHPHNYWVSRKVTGKKGMYEPVMVIEDVYLPLTIGLNYCANLAAAGPNPYARYLAKIWHSYQGQDLTTYLTLELDLVADWKNVEDTLLSILGYIIAYELYFDLNDVQGDLYIDDVYVEHSGQNWCRDPFCKDIHQDFTRAFYQIPKHWAAVELPTGTWFESNYLDT